MEDPNKEEWRIQEFRPPERNTGRLCQIWNSGLNLGKKIALTGIIASAAPLALPPLVVLSAFGVAFSVPFGFYYASYAVTDKLMSTLLSNPNPPSPPPWLQYDVFGDDEEQKLCQYIDGRVEVESSEEYYDLEEEEKVLEEDVSQALQVRIELEEDVKDIREVLVNKFEKDGYEEDSDEYIKKEESVPSTAAEIVNGIKEADEKIWLEDGSGDMIGNGVEGVLSADVGLENDNYVEQVEEMDVFGRGVSMEDRSKPMMEFGVVQPEDLGRETAGVIESIRDEGRSEIRSPAGLMDTEEPIPSVASEILKGIQEAEEEISLMKEGRGHMLGNDVEAVVMSVEVGGENDIDAHQVQELDVFRPRRVITEENMPEVKFGDVEAEESERETTGLVEIIEDEGVSETKNLEESVPSIASEILEGVREAEEDIPLSGEEASVISSEVCREDDFGVEQVDVFGPQVSMEGSRPMVKFGDVELEELERETSERAGSIRDELVSETKNHMQPVENEEPIPSRVSEILKGIQEAEDEISLKEGKGEIIGNEIETVVASAEVDGENDVNVEQGYEVDISGPRVNMEDNRSKVKFGDVEPDELERETTGMIESIRDEGITETANDEHAMEKAPPFMPDDSNPEVDGIQQVFMSSVSLQNDSGPLEGNFGNVEPREKTSPEKESEFTEPVLTIQDTRRDDKLVLTKEEIHSTMNAIPEEGEYVRHSGEVTDVTGDYKDLEGIGSEKQTEGTTAEEVETIAAEEDPVHVKKLVVHFKKTGNIKATSIREETVICVRADTSRLDMLGQDHDHPEGKDLNSDHEIPLLVEASTSTTPVEGVNNEGHIWKQINAMRTIVGYEAEPNTSYVEELKALYVFTGVEPPESFMEPTSMADVNEKLQFLMAIVGVK